MTERFFRVGDIVRFRSEHIETEIEDLDVGVIVKESTNDYDYPHMIFDIMFPVRLMSAFDYEIELVEE
jgi:hypothetical protein